MTHDLDILAQPQNQENLLLAEAAGWLHDMGKCDERLLQKSALDYDRTNPIQYNYQKTHLHLVETAGYLELLAERPVSLKTLLGKYREYKIEDIDKHWLLR